MNNSYLELYPAILWRPSRKWTVPSLHLQFKATNLDAQSKGSTERESKKQLCWFNHSDDWPNLHQNELISLFSVRFDRWRNKLVRTFNSRHTLQTTFPDTETFLTKKSSKNFDYNHNYDESSTSGPSQNIKGVSRTKPGQIPQSIGWLPLDQNGFAQNLVTRPFIWIR